jgi:hypothetical protein
VKAEQITRGGASGGLSRRRRTAQLSITNVLFWIESGQGVLNDPLHVIRIRTLQVCDIEHLKLKDPRSGILPQSQPWLIASVAEVCHQQALAVSIEHR